MSKDLALRIARMRALPSRIRQSLIKRIDPGFLKDYAFETDFFGLTFCGNVRNAVDRKVFFCGAHEKYMLFFLRDFVRDLQAHRPGPITFLDVGANTGNHTLFMSTLVDQVHAFEPFARVREQLEHHIRINRLTNIRVHPYGLSKEDAVLPFYGAAESNLGAASFSGSHEAHNFYLTDLPVALGDRILREEGIKADIIKMDVEGFEGNVLVGLQETITRDRPLVVLELSPTTRTHIPSEEALKALFPADYSFFYFASGHRETGRYSLAKFTYELRPHIEDVIAVPNAWAGFVTFSNKV